MRVLNIGANGQLGQLIANHYDFKHQVVNLTRAELDISDPIATQRVLTDHAAEVIFLSAYDTRVDYCEEHPDQSYLTNVVGINNVVQNAGNATVVFFSSDFVFDGREGLYDAHSLPNPICQYGLQKLIAENIVTQNCARYLIVRVSVVFGPTGNNFVKLVLKILRSQQTFTGATDEIVTPTPALNLVEFLTPETVCSLPNGIYHLASSTPVSRYKLAKDIARVFDLNPNLVIPVKSAELGRTAKRPLNTSLHCVTKFPSYLNCLNQLKEYRL